MSLPFDRKNNRLFLNNTVLVQVENIQSYNFGSLVLYNIIENELTLTRVGYIRDHSDLAVLVFTPNSVSFHLQIELSRLGDEVLNEVSAVIIVKDLNRSFLLKRISLIRDSDLQRIAPTDQLVVTHVK